MGSRGAVQPGCSRETFRIRSRNSLRPHGVRCISVLSGQRVWCQLWEDLLHVALKVAPAAATALVRGDGAWPQRLGGSPRQRRACVTQGGSGRGPTRRAPCPVARHPTLQLLRERQASDRQSPCLELPAGLQMEGAYHR
jgi:hypothetical protein